MAVRIVALLLATWAAIIFAVAGNTPGMLGQTLSSPPYMTLAPLLDLNFARGSYFTQGQNLAISSILTTVRNSAETCTSSTGVLTYVTANNPCITDLGIASWNATVNNLLQSQFAATWTAARATLTANTVPSLDGTTNAATLIEDSTATSTHLTTQTIVKTGATRVYNYSVYAKANGRSRIALQLDDAAGNGAYTVCDLSGQQVGVAATGIGTPFTALSSGADPVGAWTRCWLQATSNAATSAVATIFLDSGSGTGVLSNSYSGNGSSGAIIFGAQLENNGGSATHTFAPTPYIPTVGATASRVVDIITASLATAPMSSLNLAAYTMYAAGTPQNALASSFNQVPFSIDDATNNNRAQLLRLTATSIGQAVLASNGVLSVNAIIGVTLARNSPYRLAFAVRAGQQLSGVEGSLRVFNGSAMPLAPTAFVIGNNGAGSGPWGGTLSRVMLWNGYISGDIGGLTSQ